MHLSGDFDHRSEGTGDFDAFRVLAGDTDHRLEEACETASGVETSGDFNVRR